MSAGRYAPSPTGDLHVGNLRTAMVAWLFAQSTDRPLLLRFEDLDASRTVPGSAQQQRADLEAMGVRFHGEPLIQSQRQPIYDDALATLDQQGLVYECFCTRREIQQAPQAPHAPPGAYPGNCRDLTEDQRQRRRAQRPPAIRLRSPVAEHTVTDLLLGEVSATVDDMVLRRNDGAASYQLAVVVDDHLTGVDQVVRADDLASSAPRQAVLAELLYGSAPDDGPAIQWVHVPLVVNSDGQRLAKRDGAVTLAQLLQRGVCSQRVRDLLLDSLGLPAGELARALEHFDPASLPRESWVFSEESLV